MAEQHHGSDHVVPTRIYYGIFAILLILTGVTVAAAYVDLGRMNTVVALAIACFKALIVVLYFMHVKYSTPRHQADGDCGALLDGHHLRADAWRLPDPRLGHLRPAGGSPVGRMESREDEELAGGVRELFHVAHAKPLYGVLIQRKCAIAQVSELGGIELAAHQSTARVRVGAQEEMTDFVGKSAPERHAETAFFECDEVISHIAAGPRDERWASSIDTNAT